MSDPATDMSLPRFSAALAAIVERAAPSVVAVHSHRSRSSGFVWRHGLIVTADEPLAEEGEITVAMAGGTASATVVGRDPSTDVALLRIADTTASPAALHAGPPRAGSLALVVGAHEGGPLVGFGAVSFAGPGWRSMRGGEIDARIELDVSLRRVAEGGLAVDAEGHAFGMAVFGPRRRALVIPGATIERVAARLESHGRIARGYLGLGLQPVRVDEGVAGVIVVSVARGGPGAAADVRQGDVIVAWDGKPVRDVRSLVRALGPETVGTVAVFSIRRAGEPMEIRLTVGERPSA